MEKAKKIDKENNLEVLLVDFSFSQLANEHKTNHQNKFHVRINLSNNGLLGKAVHSKHDGSSNPAVHLSKRDA